MLLKKCEKKYRRRISTDVRKEDVEAFKTRLKTGLDNDMKDPFYWLNVISRRHLAGKDFTTNHEARIKSVNVDKVKAKKINRFIGIEAMVMGILFIISLFFPAFVTMACIILLIPYGLVSIIYGIVIEKKK